MGTTYLSTSRVARSPVRVQQWNTSIRAGDDFKLAVTVFGDDAGTPALVDPSRSMIALMPDQCGRWGGGFSCDYGMAWASGGSVIPAPLGVLAALCTPGYIPSVVGVVLPGRLNFYIPSGITAGLWAGRYRLSIQVDLPDGEFCQVEGIMAVREPWGPILGHQAATYFNLDTSVLDGPDLMPPGYSADGSPVDLDGFLLNIGSVAGGIPGITPETIVWQA